MSVTTRHLEALRDAVHAGAHVVLRGHLHDEVLYEDRIVDERWAISEILRDSVRLDAVVAADAARGLQCVDPNTRELVARVLAVTPEDDDPDPHGPVITPELGARTGVEVAMAARRILRQRDVAIAVVLDDLDLMFDPSEEVGRQAIARLRRAVEQAEIRRGDGPVARRNLLVLLDADRSEAGEQIARLPGVRILDAAPPDRPERAAVLARLARGFYGAQQETREIVQGFDVLADITHGWSVREHEQLRRVSYRVEVPPSRPASLVAKMPGRTDGNLIARVGFQRVKQELEAAIVGQDHALERLLAALEAAEHPSALRPHGAPPTRPLMTALMFGPTGVGKTEVARTLGRALFGSERALLRIDCAELKGPHDIARLTGAPPGYVGHEAGGMLSGPLRRRPGSIVLFDEFEKANPALGELLLGVLDDGRLTDGRGDTVQFGQAIVLLTTNIGAKELADRLAEGPIGTTELIELSTKIARQRISRRLPDGDGELVGLGRPELWSRLQDGIVPFDVLRDGALDRLVGKYCHQLCSNLDDELDVRLTIRHETFVAPVASQLKTEQSWDGRTVAHQIRLLVEQPLRDALERTAPGERVTVSAGPGGRALVERAMAAAS